MREQVATRPRPAGRPSGATRAAHRRKVYRRRRIAAGIGGAIVVCVVLVVWSLLGALATPGNQSFNAKWADWVRAHHGSFIIDQFESYYYSSHAPKKGGAPKGANALPAASKLGGPSAHHGPTPLPAPASIPLVTAAAFPGEGQWQAVGPTVGGAPGMYEAQFRADTTYTSEITSAVWIDPRLLQVQLVPGLTEPGGAWPVPPYVTDTERSKVLAAFNGGFRFQDAKGGFYAYGRQAVPLRPGAASLVLYSDGRVDVGTWGSEVTMTPRVSAVLQNLVPMVDAGQVSPAATYGDTKVWGNTLGSRVVVARSGVGVTANGALVYVAGPALTARTLAESLQRAGAVRAMTLDINPEWVTFNFFSHTDGADPSVLTPSKLYPQMQRPASRYLGPTAESRDFFTVSLR